MKAIKEKTFWQQLKNGQTIWLDIILFNAISLLMFIMPFAHYRYKKTEFTISGMEFISGTMIQNRTVEVAPQMTMIAIAILSVLSIIAAILLPKMKKIRLSGIAIGMIAFVQLILHVLFASGIESTLSESKKVGVSYGAWISAFITILILVRVIWLLYLNKILSVLDIMILPGALYLFINNYCPMAGLYLAFKKIDYSVGFIKSPWVGLKNFAYLFSTSDEWVMTRNTILYNVAFIILGNAMGILVGLFLSEIISKKLKKFYQTAVLLPQLISIIIVAND